MSQEKRSESEDVPLAVKLITGCIVVPFATMLLMYPWAIDGEVGRNPGYLKYCYAKTAVAGVLFGITMMTDAHIVLKSLAFVPLMMASIDLMWGTFLPNESLG